MIPLGLTLAESGSPSAEKGAKRLAQLAVRLLKNPLILAILAGALMSLCRLRLPDALLRPIDMLAAASAPAALFAVGGTLAGMQIKGATGDITRMVLAKLVLHPLAVILMLCLVPSLDPVMKKAMVIFASAPMLSILAILGRPYGQEQIGAAALMVATTLSFFTISLLLLFIEGRTPF
jgi:predicted permease